MKTKRVLTGCIAVLMTCTTVAFGADRADAVTEIEDYLSRLGALGFAGTLVMVEGGRPLLAAGYGLADRERQVVWTPATVSTVGSITKQFTGAAILKLVEAGQLRIEDRIDQYLPGVPADKEGITLHQLLTHSSGIVDLEGYGDWDPIRREEFVRRAMEQDLAFEPGTGFEYSNAGYSLLGAIIERLSGETYETFLSRQLFLPQGMFETGYILPRWGEARLAQGYRGDEAWGDVLSRPMAEDGPFWVLRANGGIHATAWDMVRWGQALLTGRVLSEASIERSWAPHVDEGFGDSFYGYGWVVMDQDGTRVITHNGGNGIFFADMLMVPAADLVMVVQTNVAADWPLVGNLLGDLANRLLDGAPLPTVPDVVSGVSTDLKPFGGLYLLEGGGRMHVEPLADRLDVHPEDPTSFAAVLSTRRFDAERAMRLTLRIHEIARAYFSGDYAPLAAAYGDRVPAAELLERGRERMAALEAEFGSYVAYAVLGTAMREGRDVTLLRLDFENGKAYRAYVWDPDEEESLLGVSRRGLDPVLHVFPVAGGGYASWDALAGVSRQVEIAATSEGGVRMAIGDTVEAARKP